MGSANSANNNTMNYKTKPGDLIQKSSKFDETINKVGTILPPENMPTYEELGGGVHPDAEYERVGGPKGPIKERENLQTTGEGNLPAQETGDKNWWTGEGFSADHWLSQAGADNPNAIGAGTVFGGKKGGGIGGVLGATIRAAGSHFTGDNPTYFSESSANFTRPEQTDKNYDSGETADANVESPGSDGNPLYPVQESEEYKQNFRESFAKHRNLRERTFSWMGEDDISREYSTQLKDESQEDWNTFLNNTMEGEAAADIISTNSDNAFT